MKVLLDTHCWLFWTSDPARLNAAAERVFEERRDAVYLSSVSVWEIAIKWSLGKLKLPSPPDEHVPSRLADEGISTLAVEQRHALAVAGLPWHHQDPFDRMLIAQARVDDCAVLTADPAFLAYEVEVIWASPARAPKRRRH